MKDSNAFVADSELLTHLETRSRLVHLDSDRTLFCQGDPPTALYIVRSGAANLTMHSAGEVIMRIQVGPGSLLGLPAVIGTKPYTLSAEAIPGSEISAVSSEDFTELMRTTPVFSLKVLQVLAAEVRFARQALSDL